jgi:hypothetical protein
VAQWFGRGGGCAVLFAATSRSFPQAQTIFATLPPGHILRQLLGILAKHVDQAALRGLKSDGCRVLTIMRDGFRKELVNINCARGMGSSDATFVSTP